MTRSIFVNLPVKDLKRSIAFFTSLGFTFNAQFTDATTTCMIVNETAFVMLLEEARFKGFTRKAICDASTHTEVLVAISADSRKHVEEIVTKALAGGGKPANEPQDHGFMYGSSFQDPDGHIWEVIWMNPDHVQK